jgi:hypothetical protein
MHAMPAWNLDAASILTRRELAAVLADLKVRRSLNARRNLMVFHLAWNTLNSPDPRPTKQSATIHLPVVSHF